MLALHGFRQPQAINKAPWEPKFVTVTTERRARLPKKTTAGCWESWDTHSRWWYGETVAVWPQCKGKLRRGKKTKIHQKVVTLTSVWSPAWSKAAQNKTPSDGLIRVAKACRHLFFLNPLSILSRAKKQCDNQLRHCESHWNRKSSPSSCRCQSWTRQWIASPSFRLPEANGSRVSTRAAKTNLRQGNFWAYGFFEVINLSKLPMAHNQVTTSWQPGTFTGSMTRYDKSARRAQQS